MRQILSILLAILGFSLALPHARAEGRDAETWIADSRGRIVIATDGSVSEVSFDRTFGSGIDEALAGQIRAWRFEPVLEQGRPVEAIAHMDLRLTAEFEGSRQGKVSIASARFVDPPAATGAKARDLGWKRPVYPKRALQSGHGALLSLRIEVDEAGRVVNVGGESSWLTGPALSPKQRERMLERFIAAARRAVLDWQMPPPAETGSRSYSVPINFLVGQPGTVWRQARWVALPPEPWMLALDGSTIAELDEHGRPARRDLRLLTELDPGQEPSS